MQLLLRSREELTNPIYDISLWTRVHEMLALFKVITINISRADFAVILMYKDFNKIISLILIFCNNSSYINAVCFIFDNLTAKQF